VHLAPVGIKEKFKLQALGVYIEHRAVSLGGINVLFSVIYWQ
jgi:hypothetical protein